MEWHEHDLSILLPQSSTFRKVCLLFGFLVKVPAAYKTWKDNWKWVFLLYDFVLHAVWWFLKCTWGYGPLLPVGVQLIFGSHLTEKACCEGAVRRSSSSSFFYLCLRQWPRPECPVLDPNLSLSVDTVMLHLYPILSRSSSQPDNLRFWFDLEPFSWLWTW